MHLHARPATALLLLLCACARASDAPDAAEPFVPPAEPEPVVALADAPLLDSAAVRVVVERTVRGPARAPLAGIADVELAPDGRLLVLDAAARDVKLFDAGNRLERVLGRAGEGPGELGPVARRVFLAGPDTVLVVDPSLGRLVRLRTDGTPLASARLATHDGELLDYEYDAHAGRVRDAFLPITTAPDRRARPEPVLLLRPALERDRGDILELPSEADSGAAYGHSAYDPFAHWALGDDGRIVLGWAGRHRVRIYEPDGTLRLVLQRDAPRVPITGDDADLVRRTLLGVATPGGAAAARRATSVVGESYTFPTHYPAFADVAAGPDGETWVQRTATAQDVAAGRVAGHLLSGRAPVWDVHDRDGQWLMTVTVPNTFQLTRIQGRTLVGHALDDRGAPVALVLRVVTPEP